MADFTFSKTVGTALLAHTQLASGAITVGSAVSVATKLAAMVGVEIGRTTGTALTNELLLRLQASFAASNDDRWYDLIVRTTATGKTTANSTTLNGATSAGASTFAVASATGIVKGSRLYLRETGTPGDSEWCDVRDVSGTTITPNSNLTRAHTNGITVVNFAERIILADQIPLDGIERLRLIVDGGSSTSGQTVDVRAWINTLDKTVSTT